MKLKSHREVSKALTEDFNLSEGPFLRGSVYPDKVGMKKYKRIQRVKVSFPHHYGTTIRIKSLLLRLRSHILKGTLDHFGLGCLSHLIQDSVVFPSRHKKFKEFEEAVGKHSLEDDWRDEKVPLKDGIILNELGYILKMDNPNNPKMALREGYLKNKIILKSLLQDPDLPQKYRSSYDKCKEELESRKKLRYSYWLLTYLNPLAPINAIADGKAIANKNIAKRYSHIKKSAWYKAFFCGFAVLIGLAADIGLMWIPWIALPIFGQILTAFIKIPKEILRNLEWFNFEHPEEAKVIKKSKETKKLTFKEEQILLRKAFETGKTIEVIKKEETKKPKKEDNEEKIREYLERICQQHVVISSTLHALEENYKKAHQEEAAKKLREENEKIIECLKKVTRQQLQTMNPSRAKNLLHALRQQLQTFKGLKITLQRTKKHCEKEVEKGE